MPYHHLPIPACTITLFRVCIYFWPCILLAGLPAYSQPLVIKHDLTPTGFSGAEAVAFSPDGKLLAGVHTYGRLQLWDVETGKSVAEVKRFAEKSAFAWNRGLAFRPDGKLLAIGVASGVDNTTGRIHLWEIRGGKELRQGAVLKGHTDAVRSLAFGPDGKTLYSAGIDREIRVWDVEAGKSIRTLTGHQSRILGLALSPDGKVLVTGDPGEVKVWNLESNKEARSWKVDELIDLAYSPDGKTIAVCCFPASGITFWDVATGRKRDDMKPLPNRCSPMAFSPDGLRFISVTRDRYTVPTTSLTDLADGRVRATHTHSGSHVHVAAFSPDGKLLVSGDHTSAGTAKLHLLDLTKAIPDIGRK